MIPNFTFRDPTLFSVAYGSMFVFIPEEFGSEAITFLEGRYGPASGWFDNGAHMVTFDSGSHTVEIVSAGSRTEPVTQQTTFQSGTYRFALIDGGTFIHNAAMGISAGSGTYFECAIVTDMGTESMPTDITFFEGAHNEVAIGPVVTETGSVSVAFGSGSYYDALPNVDPMANKAVIRFVITPGATSGSLVYTSQGNPVAYNADYGEDHYIVLDTPNSETIQFESPWAGTIYEDRYQLLFDAPVFPPPSGAPPGIVIISNGTGTNVGTLTSEPMNWGASFHSGTYFHMVIAGSMPRDTVPNFCTFLYGSHTFVRDSGSVSEDFGAVAVTFGTGSYVQKVITSEFTENGTTAITFLTGAHELVATYATADSTVITADCGTITSDNCKPFSFDNGTLPSFDEDVVFNFSQL